MINLENLYLNIFHLLTKENKKEIFDGKTGSIMAKIVDKRLFIMKPIFEFAINSKYKYDFFTYLKDNFEIISVVEHNDNMTNLYFKSRDLLYYIPMNYVEDLNYVDENVHFTEDSLHTYNKIVAESDKLNIKITSRKMISSFIKNNNNQQYFPILFSYSDLYKIFPKEKYNILLATYSNIINDFITEEDDCKGITIHPLLSDLRLDLEFAKEFQDIEYIYGINIENKIQKLSHIAKETDEFKEIYEDVIKQFYSLDSIYTILSIQKLNNNISEPIISTKNNIPALYLFTNYRLAKRWCEHFNFKSNGNYLIGKLDKNKDFDNVFSIALMSGCQYIYLNEGDVRFLTIPLKDFIDINNISKTVNIYITEEEMKQSFDNNQINLRFNKCPIYVK